MENQSTPSIPAPTTPSTPMPVAPSEVTPEQQSYINHPSFGAFSLGLVYFLASGLIKEALMMLIPFYNIYLWIRGIARGRRLSWQKGAWRDFETFKNRQKVLDRIGIGFLVVWLAIIGFVLVTVFAVTRAPIKTATQIITDLGAGKIEQVYNSAAPEFQGVAPLEDFQTFVSEKTKLSEFTKVKFTSAEVKTEQGETMARVSGKYTTKSDDEYPITIDLIKLGDSWQMLGMGFSK